MTTKHLPTKQRKVVILGNMAVGKSSLTLQQVDKQFVDSYDPTVENTFTTAVAVNGQQYQLEIVDTAGLGEHSMMSPHHATNVHGFILVYSISSRQSFDIVDIIHSRLADLTGQVSVPIILVGNKKDLERERMVSPEEGRRLAQSWNALFLEASAKRNESVKDIFTQLLMEIERMDGTMPAKSYCCLQ